MNLLIPAARLHYLRKFALGILLLQVFPLVIHLLAFSEPDLNLDQAVLEVQAQRNRRVALLPDASIQLVDLLAMQQQLAVTVWLMVLAVAEVIGRDRKIMQKGLAIANQHKGFVQASLAGPQGFHLSPLKHHAGFKLILDEIVVIGFFIAADQFLTHLNIIPEISPKGNE